MKKGRLVSLLLSFAVTALVLILFLRGTFTGLENQSIDYRFKVRGDRPSHERVAIITIDEKSIAEMGRWPWSREVHARLVDWLGKAGVSAVAFDVLFTEADRDRPHGDRALARSSAKAGNVVLGMLFQVGDDGLPAQPLVPLGFLKDAGGFIPGSVNIFPEPDGVNRKVPVWMEYEGRFYPSLSLAALAAAERTTPEQAAENLALPVEGTWNEMNLNFVGGFQAFPYFSFVDVYKNRVAPELFKDKIVLVGGTATALFDFLAVPNVPVFPGLEVHANAIDNYLNRNFLRHGSFGLACLLIVLFGLSCGYLTARVPAWIGALSAVAWIGGYFAVCQVLFSRRFVILDFVGPALAVLASYVVVLFYRFITQDPSRLRLGGEEREMTVFFSDLAGFTSISEALKPADLVTVLNEYLTDMSDIILKHDGVVDKYIGDAIMAFWNAPVDQPKHATQACMAALDQMDRLAYLHKKFAERKLPLIDCRVGVNTGHMVVGNMGSKNRFDYTVMGDSVNLASRLEGANKPYHTHIMISEFTYEKAKNDVEVRQLDLLRVKGKAIPIKVYELAARKDQLSDAQKKGFKLYAEALELYLDRKFEKAKALFKKVQEVLPEDGPSEVYIQRAEGYLVKPPPKDWDGVFVMTTK
jgi:adenylate cyclase